MELTKATVARVWIIGLVLVVAGLVAGFIGGLLGVSFNSSQDVGTALSAWARTTGGIVVIAALIAAIAGGVIMFIAWILSMVANALIARWGWFAVLLVLGALGFQFFAMIAYLIWGPSERDRPQPLITPA